MSGHTLMFAPSGHWRCNVCGWESPPFSESGSQTSADAFDRHWLEAHPELVAPAPPAVTHTGAKD